MRRIVVTGAAGFIGFNYVRELLAAEPETEAIALDKLTYAGNPRSLEGIKKTIEWYLANREWTDAIRSGVYRQS